ncbi:conserved hypothetical protein [Gammaproteobacteria bacterium]
MKLTIRNRAIDSHLNPSTNSIQGDIEDKTIINDPETNKKLCNGCAKCCMHINHEIDPPENDEDCDYVIWFLLHQNISIWIDDENVWFIEFKTPCKALKKELCGIYDKRPQVCREYSQSTCLNTNLDDDIIFNTPEEFLDYMKKEKKYNYNGFYQDNIKSILWARGKALLIWIGAMLLIALCTWYGVLLMGIEI